MTATLRLDVLDVVAACNRFGWYADQRDWAAMRGLLADEVYLDYRALHGGEPASMPASAVIAGWQRDFTAFDTTQHLISNHVVDVDGDTASCGCHVQATHVPVAGGRAPWVLGGQYRMRLSRSADGWRIGEVTLTPSWSTGEPAPARSQAENAADTRQVALAWFGHVCQGRMAQAKELLADDVEWINFTGVPGHHDCMPWHGTYHGPDAVLASFATFTSVCSVRSKQLRQLVVEGPYAVGTVHETGTAKGSGAAFEIEYIEHLTVRDGRISRWKSYTDPSSIIRALRL